MLYFIVLFSPTLSFSLSNFTVKIGRTWSFIAGNLCPWFLFSIPTRHSQLIFA